MKSDIIYQLTLEDVQNVALETLGRELEMSEITLINDKIAENINWYEIIDDAIAEVIHEAQNDKI